MVQEENKSGIDGIVADDASNSVIARFKAAGDKLDRAEEGINKIDRAEEDINKIKRKEFLSRIERFFSDDWKKTYSHYLASKDFISKNSEGMIILKSPSDKFLLTSAAILTLGLAVEQVVYMNFEAINQNIHGYSTPFKVGIESPAENNFQKAPYGADKNINTTKSPDERILTDLEKKLGEPKVPANPNLVTTPMRDYETNPDIGKKPGAQIYTVKKGDAMLKIASKYINPAKDREKMNEFYRINGKEPMSAKYTNSDNTPKWTHPLNKNPNYITVGMPLDIRPLVQNNVSKTSEKAPVIKGESGEEIFADYNISNFAYNGEFNSMFSNNYLGQENTAKKVIFTHFDDKSIQSDNIKAAEVFYTSMRLVNEYAEQRNFEGGYYRNIHVSFVYDGGRIDIRKDTPLICLDKICALSKFI